MQSIICESMSSDKVAMVNQHALRAATQFSLWTTCGKILRKNLRPHVEHFKAFVDEFSLSEDSGSFISSTRRKSCLVRLAMADVPYTMCRTRKESVKTSIEFHKGK